MNLNSISNNPQYQFINNTETIKNKSGSSANGIANGGYTSPVQMNRSEKPKSTGECQTCSERKYQDRSNDPGVSFQSPTQIAPEQAFAKVRGHEMEHVARERGKASQENRQIVSQSVTYQTGVCPECGSTYISGGTTNTVTKTKAQTAGKGFPGEILDVYA